MNVKVDVEIPRNIPIKELNRYVDNTVFNAARITLDFAVDKERIPYRKGNLQKATEAYGVEKMGDKTYQLGVDSTVSYAKYVWDYPQKTNWTNPNTYAKWFITEYKNERELIMHRAIENAKKGIRVQ